MAIRFLSGETIDGDATFSGHITLASDKKVNFGASSYIEGATSGSKLMFRSSDDMIFQPGSSTKVTFQANGNATFEGNVTLAATKKLQYADDKIIIGNTNSTLGNEAISLGYDADSTGNQSIGIGYNPEASGTYSVAIGYNVTASGTSTFVFGTSGSHSDNNTLVASGLDLKVTGTGTSTFAGNVSGVTASFGSGTSRFTDTSAYPLQLNRGLAVDTVGAAGVILGLGSYSTGTTYVDAVRIVGVLEGNGTNGDMQLQVLNSGSYTNALTLNNNNDATFAGDVTINGTITLGTASFVGTVAGQTVVSSEGAYASSGSVKLYEAKRSGGAVGGDWSYDDATTDMSLGTNTNHAFALKTNNTRRLTISNDGEIRVANQTLVKGSNSKYNMTFPDNGGIAIGSAYTFANVYGSSGDLYLRANSYPANTGSNSTIYLQTSNSSGGQANDVVIQNGNVGIGTTSPAHTLDVQKSGDNLMALTGVVNGGVSSIEMRQSRGSLSSPSNSSANGDGNYIISQIYRDSGYNTAGHIGIVTGPTTDDGEIIFSTALSGTVSEKMRIDENGNVGINNTSPAKKLEISSGTDGDGILLTGTGSFATGSSRNIEFSYNDSDTSYASAIKFEVKDNTVHGGQIGFFTDAGPSSSAGLGVLTRAMTIDPSQNVGIGTTAIPTNGYIASGGGWKMLQIGQSSQIAAYGTDDEIAICQNTYLNTSGVFQAITSDVAGSSIILVDGKINFKRAATSGTTQTTSVSMFIDTTGKVGIGTTSPTSRLHVNGSGATHGEYLRISNGTTQIYELQPSIYNVTNNGFGIYDVTDSAYRLVIDTTGNVGIGTTSPDATLDVHAPSTTAPSLTMGAAAGQIFKNEDSELAFGLMNASPYNVWMQSRFNGNVSRPLLINPLGGNVGIGTTSPSKKLSVDGGIRVGNNGTEAGASKIYGDIQRPDALSFTKRNYTLLAGSSGSTYFLARQWHDNINWGAGNINVIIWGVYYGKTQYNKSDFSCRYGYSSSDNDVVANFNPGSMAVPYWTSATTVSGNIEYRDLKIDIPAYQRYSFEIINPGAMNQTYNINNTSNNTCYFYPH
jgi:hypothetical protein